VQLFPDLTEDRLLELLDEALAVRIILEQGPGGLRQLS